MRVLLYCLFYLLLIKGKRKLLNGTNEHYKRDKWFVLWSVWMNLTVNLKDSFSWLRKQQNIHISMHLHTLIFSWEFHWDTWKSSRGLMSFKREIQIDSNDSSFAIYMKERIKLCENIFFLVSSLMDLTRISFFPFFLKVFDWFTIWSVRFLR